MPLDMKRNVFITCAVTGSGDTTDKSHKVPETPQQIADSALDAARAGAATCGTAWHQLFRTAPLYARGHPAMRGAA